MGLHLPGVVDDAAVQLAHLREALVPEPGAGLLAADAAGAIQEYRLVFPVLQLLHHLLHRLPEGFGFRKQGTLEMPDQAFVVVAHVHHQRPFLHFPVEGGGIEMLTDVRQVEGLVGQPIGHQLGPHLDGELQEARGLFLQRDLEGHSGEFRPGIEPFPESVERFAGHRDLGIDPLPGQVSSPEHAQLVPFSVQRIPEGHRIGQPHIAVEGQRGPGAWVLRQPLPEHRRTVDVPQFLQGMQRYGCRPAGP